MLSLGGRLYHNLCALCIPAILLIAGTGCSHSRPKPTQPTGSPEALSIVAQLQAMNRESDPSSAEFTHETIQDQASFFAENAYEGRTPPEYLQKLPKAPSTPDARERAFRQYVEETLKNGIPTGTYREVRHGPIDHGWRMNIAAYPRQLRYLSFSGVVSLRHETADGRELIVLREDHDLGLGSSFYREYYLDPQEQLLPRRIVQRYQMGPAAATQTTTRPTGDLTITQEYDRGFWRGGREIRQYTVPAAAVSLLDFSHHMYDYETTIDAYMKRPNGTWFITQATTWFPFSHRTEKFSAQNVTFAPPAPPGKPCQ